MKSMLVDNDQQHDSYRYHNDSQRCGITSRTPSSASPPPYGFNNNILNGAVASRHAATSGYDTLQLPFKYDSQRGRWSSPIDFYFACVSHFFGINMFLEVPVYALLFGGVYCLPAFILANVLYTIPIFIIQTFLGQFSTSGTISAFRVVPLFKGIGYSILILNLSILSYYAINAAIPLVYAANSLHAVLPWMSCNNTWNSLNCSEHSIYDEELDESPTHATVEFFRAIVRTAHSNATPFTINWPVLGGVLAVWLVVLAVLLKRISFIGKVLRIQCLLMLTLFLAIFVQLLLQSDWRVILDYFIKPSPMNGTEAILSSMRSVIYTSTWPFGLGWGTVLTLASHNTFRRNSERIAYWVIGTQIVLTLMGAACGLIAFDHLEDHVGFMKVHFDEKHFLQFLYIAYAYLFGSMKNLSNFWSFLFFSMLFLGELCSMIVQMMTVLTALFDEYQSLRTKKTEVTIGLVGVLMLTSLYFCTKQGFEHFHMLPNVACFTNVVISLILLLMVTWIYGRARFQCDLQFMLGKTISNFKIFLIRFITPIFMCLILAQLIFFVEEDPDEASMLLIISQSSVYIIAVVYMIYKLCQMTGPIMKRLRKSLKPQDWYPVDADNRHFYEEIMGTSEMLVMDCYDLQHLQQNHESHTAVANDYVQCDN